MTDDLRLRIARELTTIVSLYADLHTEALHRPANSAGLYIPGGEPQGRSYVDGIHTQPTPKPPQNETSRVPAPSQHPRRTTNE